MSAVKFVVICIMTYFFLTSFFLLIPTQLPGLHALIFFLFGAGQCVNALLFVPQIMKALKVKSAEELSFTMFFGFNILQMLGLLFSRAVSDHYAVVGYISSLLICGLLTSIILYYRNSKRLIFSAIFYFLMLILILLSFVVTPSGILREAIFLVFGFGQIANSLLYVPQIFRLIKHKTAVSLSLWMYLGFNLLQGLGILFSREAKDLLAVLGCTSAFVLCGATIGLIVFYRGRKNE